MPAVVVGDQGDRGVTDLRLACELRLLQIRHADDVGTPRSIEPRLGECRELRTLHADVRPTVVNRGVGALPAGGRDVFDAEHLHAEDVGAEVQLGWREAMASAMAS